MICNEPGTLMYWEILWVEFFQNMQQLTLVCASNEWSIRDHMAGTVGRKLIGWYHFVIYLTISFFVIISILAKSECGVMFNTSFGICKFSRPASIFPTDTFYIFLLHPIDLLNHKCIAPHKFSRFVDHGFPYTKCIPQQLQASLGLSWCYGALVKCLQMDYI